MATGEQPDGAKPSDKDLRKDLGRPPPRHDPPSQGKQTVPDILYPPIQYITPSFGFLLGGVASDLKRGQCCES